MTGFTNSVWFWVAGLCLSCSHPFPAPTITSLNRHLVVGRVVPGHRVWAGTLASFGPVGRHACNPTRFGTAGGSACCRVPRLPAPNGMSWASHLSQEKSLPSSLLPLQHPTRNAQRKTNCSHGGPCSLAIVRPRSPLSGTESQRPRSRFPRHRGARTDRDFDWSRGIGASLEGLDQRCCWLGSSARGIPPTPLLHWHCPRRKPARPELLNGRLAVGHGYPTRRISPMQTRTETRIGGRVSADPTGATVVFFHTRGLLRFGEGLGHWRMRLRCLTANGSTPSPTRPGASFCPPRRVCSQVRCANFNGLSRLVRTRGGGQQALQPSGLHLRRGLPGTGGCLPPTRHDRGRQPAPVVQPQSR